MTGITGTIYLLHFSQPYQHVRHYTGWTLNLAERLAAHSHGSGSRLVEVISGAGISFALARTTTGTRDKERAIKNAGGQVRYCPLCTPQPRKGRWA
jgi:predicted GIY-YIG superfamily endonuclease